MAATRVVNRSDDRRAWSVRAAVGAPATSVHPDREAAITAAARELRGLAGGGTLHVFHPDGRLDYRTTIAEEPAAATSLGQRVQDDLDRGDNAVDMLSTYVWPLLGLLFGPALSSLVTQAGGHAAIRSYGLLGAAVGAAAGVFAGSRVVRYHRAHSAG